MSNEIVIVNATETLAPTPPTLQQFGAMVSQGGTTLPQGTTFALSSPSALASILTAPLSLTGIVQTAGLATATAAAAHGITNGDTFLTTISGATGSTTAYNGTFLATATGAETFTFAVPTGTTSPATGTLTYTTRNVAELVAMNDEWWAQQNSGTLAPYVLEVGAGEDTAGIAELATYLTNNPNNMYQPGATNFFYSYMVPRSWASDSSYLTLVAAYSTITSRTNFFTTMTAGNYTSFPKTSIRVCGLVEAPSIPPTEFSIATGFFNSLNFSPSTTNKVPPLCFSPASDVTPYPTSGNLTLLAALKAAGVNYIGTGAEGGINADIFQYGAMLGGLPFNFYYAVDWAQINIKVALANAVINGSATSINPLYYNQPGINTLQAVAANVMTTGIQSGLILGTLVQTELDPTTFANNVSQGLYTGNCVINAVPFQTYLNANPGNYATGVYGGFSCVMTPQLGFTQIIFNLDATTFA
jgi:hypothetical protein